MYSVYILLLLSLISFSIILLQQLLIMHLQNPGFLRLITNPVKEEIDKSDTTYFPLIVID